MKEKVYIPHKSIFSACPGERCEVFPRWGRGLWSTRLGHGGASSGGLLGSGTRVADSPGEKSSGA
jgi:hypothetical protein